MEIRKIKMFLTSFAIWSRAWSSTLLREVPRRLPTAPGLSIVIDVYAVVELLLLRTNQSLCLTLDTSQIRFDGRCVLLYVTASLPLSFHALYEAQIFNQSEFIGRLRVFSEPIRLSVFVYIFIVVVLVLVTMNYQLLVIFLFSGWLREVFVYLFCFVFFCCIFLMMMVVVVCVCVRLCTRFNALEFSFTLMNEITINKKKERFLFDLR